MAEVKWIKIVTDIFDDEKILLIESLPSSDSIIVIWFKLLCLAGKNNNNGVFLLNDRIAYTDEMLATIFRRDVNTVRFALKTFEEYGMVEIVDNVITIPNWDKHQSLDAYEKKKIRDREYQKQRREKQKMLAEKAKSSDKSSDSNTTPSSDVAVSEEDKEEEEDKDKNKTTTTSSSRGCGGDVKAEIISYMLDRGFTYPSPIQISKILTDIEIYNIDEVKKSIDIADNNGKHTYSYVKGILEKRRAQGDSRRKSDRNSEPSLDKMLEEEGLGFTIG